jgi:hypothetical protein
MIGAMIELALEERNQLVKNDGTVVVFTEDEREQKRRMIADYSVDQRKKIESTLSRIKK